MNTIRSMDRRLFTIILVVFVQLLGASMVVPILPLYAKRDFNMTPEVITLLVTAFFAAQFIAGPYLGRLSDRYGRVPILIISQIGTAVSFAMIGFAQSVEVLFLARIFDGITGGNIIVAQAYVTDIMPREKRTQALGYIFLGFGFGFVIGPALGGLLSAEFGIRIPFILAAIGATAVVILTWLTLDETLSPEQRAANRAAKGRGLQPREVMANYPLLTLLFVVFVGQFGFGLVISTFALYGEAVLFAGQGEAVASRGIGLLLAVFGLFQVATQLWVLQPLVRRFGDARLVAVGAIFRGIASFIFAIVTTPFLAVFGNMSFSIGTGIMIPTTQSLATATVADEFRGGVLG
ncbi:MFS transporter, partial [candidate division KSB1 bacterium]|nr:MFS transporter [candidate division KSB1 bacterium]